MGARHTSSSSSSSPHKIAATNCTDESLSLSVSPMAKRARLEAPAISAAAGVGVTNCSRKRKLRSSPLGNFPTPQERPTTEKVHRKRTSSVLVPPHPKWEGLPYVALVEIFRRLPNNDKYNASLTCRSWRLPFSRPALWRRGNFRFNGVDDWRALCFASMMGAALRHVTIDCSSKPEPRLAKVSASVDNLGLFLTSLVNSGNRHMASFHLSHLRRFARLLTRPDCDVVRLMTQLLADQKMITSLRLDHAGLPADDAFQLLMAAVDGCEDSVQSVSICETIVPILGYDVASDPRLLSLLARFTHLSELSLSHRYLSDELLYLLASTLAMTLTQISVLAGYMGRAYSRTTPNAWRHICLRCSGLQASYTLKGVSHDLSLKDILTPSIPLTHLHWNSGGFTTMVNTKVCFDHITTHFHGTLQHLELDLHLAFLDDEEDVAGIIHRCVRLESLSLKSELAVPSRRVRLERAIRRAVAHQPSSCLSHVTINGTDVALKETWATSFVGWLVEQVQ